MNTVDKLELAAAKNNSLLCVGLDPDPGKYRDTKEAFEAAKGWVDQTKDLVAAYKPNLAFWINDTSCLKNLIAYIHAVSVAPVILDAKYGDISNTAQHYAKWAFHNMGADAVTVSGYMGDEAILPFVTGSWVDKMAFVLVRTTGKTNFVELQNLIVDQSNEYREWFSPLYQEMASQLEDLRKTATNVGMVVGAIDGKALEVVRKAVGSKAWILCPGVGAQGGELELSVVNGVREDKMGLLINVARGVIGAANPRSAAMEYKEKINAARSGL